MPGQIGSKRRDKLRSLTDEEVPRAEQHAAGLMGIESLERQSASTVDSLLQRSLLFAQRAHGGWSRQARQILEQPRDEERMAGAYAAPMCPERSGRRSADGSCFFRISDDWNYEP